MFHIFAYLLLLNYICTTFHISLDYCLFVCLFVGICLINDWFIIIYLCHLTFNIHGPIRFRLGRHRPLLSLKNSESIDPELI